MAPPVIGFVGFGEVASVFSKRLTENDAEIVACDIDESKVNAPGVSYLPLADLAGHADYVLSTVTTQVALDVASEVGPHLRPGRVFVDLNTTSPSVKVEIGRTISRSGADFVEGAILGAVGASGADTRILAGGKRGSEVAETLTHLGLRVSFFSFEIGKASTFKMLRSIFSKGLEAIILELLIAGKRAGIDKELWRDVCEFMDQNPFEHVATNWARTHAVAHERRYHEMVQVTETMREIGLEPIMAAAATEFFHRSGQLDLDQAFPEKPESMTAVITHLEQQLK